MPTNLPEEFFTKESVFTLTGSVAIVYMVCGSLQKVFDFNPKWLAFAISFIISFAGVFFVTQHKLIDFFIGIANGFLIYFTSAGFNESTARPTNTGSETTRTYGGAGTRSVKRRFNSSWFH